MSHDTALSPNELLARRVHWRRTSPGRWEALVEETACLLQMNDFPDEPLYTVIVGNDRLDLDDAPKQWHIESITDR